MDKINGRLNAEERHLIKEYILLPYVLTVLEINKKQISKTPGFKLPEAFVWFYDRVMDTVTHDLTEIKKQLRKMGIKIYMVTEDETSLRCMYAFAGYEERMSMVWRLVKAEVTIRLKYYLEIGIKKT
ncbi:hypothetical protein YDYSY3_60720 [Paenibacillus chitinolyticus]|uniref:hypothetical protein n=1 Tax=Paenibacillus chitinolyticus TaxID=79263 RepID=UPI0026E4E7D2|nr:hypothetical protein [Paenibacillus chitinolyticus]GKS15072.1 hypothetical protein YDYSY3_60720 [Paenibacillus chitinolyticus]